MVTLARATELARPGGRTLTLQCVVQGPLAEPVGSMAGLLPVLRADEAGRGGVRQGLRGLASRVRGRQGCPGSALERTRPRRFGTPAGTDPPRARSAIARATARPRRTPRCVGRRDVLRGQLGRDEGGSRTGDRQDWGIRSASWSKTPCSGTLVSSAREVAEPADMFFSWTTAPPERPSPHPRGPSE